MTKKQKKRLKIIISCGCAFLFLIIFNALLKLDAKHFPNGISSIIGGKFGFLLPFLLYLTVYVFVGRNVLKKFFFNLIRGQIFDENFLMVIAGLGAFTLGIINGLQGGSGEGFDEACAVILFFELGEFLQNYAVSKSRKSITSLISLRPDYARRLTNGNEEIVDPSVIKMGDIIVVNSGEKIPLDAIVIKGASQVDEKSLTGESLPKEAYENSIVLSGSINLTSTLTLKVTNNFESSTVSKILQLVETATDKKSKTERFITKFSRLYTPIVVILAIILAVVPSIITGNYLTYIYRALNFLVISCPCALVISVPLCYFASLGTASKNGVLIKGSNYLDVLNDVNTFVFDKTGTLTKGNFKVTKIYPENKKQELLRLAYICEKNFNHPISKSILNECNFELDVSTYTVKTVLGQGNVAKSESDTILVGNALLLKNNGVSAPFIEEDGTIIYVAKNGNFLGYLVINDEIKESSFASVKQLNDCGFKTVMLTGDNEKVAKSVSNALNLSDCKYGLLPHEKVLELEKIMANKSGSVCYVGDGLNDAPVLMRADLGVAMGGIGSDASLEACDIVLINDNLTSLIKAKKIAKTNSKTVKQNVAFILLVKALILVLSALGLTNMWLAIFGDVGVSLLAILNSLRLHKNN